MNNRLTDEQYAHFKQKLEAEKAKLEEELATVAHKNPDAGDDWEVQADKMDIMTADRNEVADKLEDLEDNAAILNELEIRYNHVKRALDKIELGTYGVCEVSGESISLERLEANPAAMTRVQHATKLHN